MPSFHFAPFNALTGRIHTVTNLIVNDGGTSILMRNFRAILGLGSDSKSQTVTAQAGVIGLELYEWLAPHGLEVGNR